MAAPSLEPGHVLGGRFAIVGLLGAGGTASVYLVVDQLRGERTALKVVHPHLASDAGVLRRLRKEVAAASLLQTDTVLVPHELHELDGLLCLTLPYHRGQTLTEHVAASGPLPVEEVRQLGIRIGRALQEAHRRGLLHRDVTANNVMVENGRQAVLMDFGLVRTESSTTRSTGMLGTTGFAAPEVYAGERADPRTDLYGLGVVLYLALTGSLPFGSDNAMGTLKLQLAEGHRPVRAACPDAPEDLVSVIETLLKRERDDRPASAGEVVEALQSHVPLGANAEEPAQTVARRLHLPPGRHAVVIREREEDGPRRRVLRVEQGKARQTLEAQVTKRARELWTGVLAYVGVQETEADSPEQLLLRAVADEAQVEPGLLRQPPALLQRRFVLVEGVSRDAARRIAADARSAGFRASLKGTHPKAAVIVTAVGAVLALLSVPLLFIAPPVGLLVLLMLTGVTAVVQGLIRVISAQRQDELPVAYAASLDPWLTRAVEGRFAVPSQQAQLTQAPVETESTSRNPLLERVEGRLEALDRAVVSLDLPEVVRSDLRSTAKELRARAAELADVLERLDAELSEPLEDTGWIEPRLARLRTKQRAGEPVDQAEILRLQGVLRASEGDEALRAKLESQHTAATAGLLEIAATATSVRRTLLSEAGSEAGVTGALGRLQREAEAARRARAELLRS